MHLKVDGFDPLSDQGTVPEGQASVFRDATKRVVQNILKSYTGYFDIFSELIQNSLDAIDVRRRQEKGDYKPFMRVEIDIPGRRVRVVDNGSGMDLEQVLFCFRPNVSFKSRKESRGHKGVGATFLAYGFNSIRLSTVRDGNRIAARLSHGRAWADDMVGNFTRPKLEEIEFEVPELEGSISGTAVEIHLGDGHRPQLAWIGANSAEQWLDILRARTPLGGVYLATPDLRSIFELTLKVIAAGGQETVITTNNPEYIYPHELSILQKVKSLTEIHSAIQTLTGDLAERQRQLGEEFKRLDAIYEIWGVDALLSEESPIGRSLDDKQKELIVQHQTIVYGCFMASAKTWSKYRDDVLRINKNAVVLRGGLQIATDFMVQGELSVIPLTSAIGYQNNTHVIVHFKDGNPDMGRKTFQPELTRLAEDLSKKVVDAFKVFIASMRPDTSASITTSDSDLWTWKLAQVNWRDSNPLSIGLDGHHVPILSIPQCEQDVIVLFSSLLGTGVLRGIQLFATSEHARYDSLFLRYNKDRTFAFDARDCPLGVSLSSIGQASDPKVLEYKYDFDALIDDFQRDRKHSGHIELVVCWRIGSKYNQDYTILPYLVDDAGVDRLNYGATHAVFSGSHRLFEVICLQDLISYLQSPEKVSAEQRIRYK